jgi:prephenate dehydrogenase
MFAPALGFSGRPVALVDLCPGPATRAFAELLARHGARCVAVSAGEHDRLTAGLQVATHAAVLAFGLALRELRLDAQALVELAPPPHHAMLALLSRIASGNPEVYREIQAAHPDGPAVRESLRQALTALDGAGEPARFAELVRQLTEWLGDRRPGLAEECAELFAGMRS